MKILKKYRRSIITIYFFILNFLNFKMKKVNIKNDYKIKGLIYIKNRGVLKIDKKFRANSGVNYNPIGGDTILRFIVSDGGLLEIGSNVGISNSTICSTNKIIIEDNVMIGGGCKLWDTDFHSVDPFERIINNDNKINSLPIIIKKNAFIGANSIILKGITIGKNSIVGAGSVVSKNIPDNEIWAGNPVKFIRKIDVENEF